MARARIALEQQRDFTGGLNLADDPYKLNPSESFDLQNVDIDRRGGFGIRRGYRKYISQATQRTVTATGASRAANVVTVSGLSPLNGDPGGLVAGQVVTATGFALGGGGTDFNGTFTVATAVGGASTATWAQTAANDSTGAGTITQGISLTDSGYTYVDTSGVRHILIARAGVVERWDGAAWQDVQRTVYSGRVKFIEYRNVLYFVPTGNSVVPYRWTGTGLATQLTGTAGGNFNDDLTAPNSGNMPSCRTLAVHHEVVWAAGDIIETGPVVHSSRVRWSHPGAAEDWRTNDFIDLDPDDENGSIRALVPFGDRLLVFKDKAIYAIHGFPPAGFSVENLSKDLGTPSPFSVVVTPDAVYFWDIDRGAYRYDGKSFEWIFRPLFPLIDDGKINMAFSFQVIAEFHRDRLFLSVPYLTAPYANTFVGLVYAPYAGNNGAWTIHTNTLFGWWVHRGSVGGDEHLIGGYNFNAPYIYELDVEGLYQDINSADVAKLIEAHYTTRWFDDNNTAAKKRWKRPVVVMRGGANQITLVEVLTDYDPTLVTKTFNLETVLDGSEGVWDVSNWDAANWARQVTISGDRSVILKGAPLSGGTAKALRFKNTVIGQDWRIHGLTMKWISRRIRN